LTKPAYQSAASIPIIAIAKPGMPPEAALCPLPVAKVAMATVEVGRTPPVTTCVAGTSTWEVTVHGQSVMVRVVGPEMEKVFPFIAKTVGPGQKVTSVSTIITSGSVLQG